MTIHNIKQALHRFIGKWIFIILIVFILYTISILKDSLANGYSYWEFELLAFTNQYYVIFGLVNGFVIFVFKNLCKDEQEVLIRSKSYIKYFITQAISLLAVAVVFILLHLLIALVMGVGLSFQNIFTNSTNGNLIYLSNHFNTPMEGLIYSMIYMTVGLSTLGIFLMFLNHFFNQQIVVIVYIILFMLSAMNMWFYWNQLIPVLFLDNYLILKRTMDALNGYWYILTICEVMLISAILILIRKFWHKKIDIWRGKEQGVK